MKKNILFSLLGLIGITTSILVLDACKLKNPTDGFKIIVKADALQAPNNFYVLDAKSGNQAELPANYEVTVTGPGAPYVFSPGGTKKIVVIQGVLQFSLRKGFVPTPQNPIRFNFEFHNSKYLDLVYPVEIKSLDQFSEAIQLVNFENPPSGSTGKKQDVPSDTSGKTTTKVEIVIPKAQGKEEAAKVEIEPGTQMKDDEGKPVTGNIEAKILHATPTDSSMGSFPGGISIEGTKDASGAALPGGEVTTTGWVNFEMSAGGKQVKSFSQPVNVSMEIKDGTINPKTGTPYVVGDDLDVYSLSSGENTWVKEGTTKIVKNDSTNKLEAPMAINHLSVWMAGIILPSCGSPLQLSINNSANTEAMAGTIQVFSLTDTIRALVSHTFNIPAGAALQPVTLSSFTPAQGRKYHLRVNFSGKDPLNFRNQELCNSSINVTAPISAPGVIKFKIKIKCENGNQVLLPNNYTVYYINEDDYNSTTLTSPTLGEHKIDPSDGNVNGKYWRQKNLSAVTGANEAYNLLEFNLDDNYFVASENGIKYRFAVYYNDGSTSSREDYVTPGKGYTNTIKVSGVYPADIVLSKCPL